MIAATAWRSFILPYGRNFRKLVNWFSIYHFQRFLTIKCTFECNQVDNYRTKEYNASTWFSSLPVIVLNYMIGDSCQKARLKTIFIWLKIVHFLDIWWNGFILEVLSVFGSPFNMEMRSCSSWPMLICHYGITEPVLCCCWL